MATTWNDCDCNNCEAVTDLLAQGCYYKRWPKTLGEQRRAVYEAWGIKLKQFTELETASRTLELIFCERCELETAYDNRLKHIAGRITLCPEHTQMWEETHTGD